MHEKLSSWQVCLRDNAHGVWLGAERCKLMPRDNCHQQRQIGVCMAEQGARHAGESGPRGELRLPSEPG